MEISIEDSSDSAPETDRPEPPGSDPADTEFWDACWTLEDEWQPKFVVRSDPHPHVFVLL